MKRSKTFVRITHRPTGELLAEGPRGWAITPFEGDYYIGKKYLLTDAFRPNYLPGLCPYKFFYVRLDLALPDTNTDKSLGWMYWLPNPLLPFSWFRVALPREHPSLPAEEYGVGGN